MKNHHNKESGVNGSITVEAASIMTFVLCILFSFIIVTVWLRDRVVVASVLKEGTVMGRSADGEEVRTWVDNELGALLFAEGELSVCEIDESQGVICWVSREQPLYPGGQLLFEENAESVYRDAPEFLRMCRLAGTLTK